MKMRFAIAIAPVLMQIGTTFGQSGIDESLKAADHLFAQGSFEAARQRYQKLLESRPDNPRIIERLGYICHFSGQYGRAVECFDQAIGLNPKRRLPVLAYSAYSHYLMKNYHRALKIIKELESAGYKYETAFFSAAQLEQLIEKPPYQIDTKTDKTIVAFEALDPLPVIQVSINSKRVYAFIDTGGPQFVVDPTFAEEQSIKPVSQQISRGIGGRAGQTVGFGIVQAVGVANIEMRNVPVMFLPVRRTSEIFGVQIDAVLGTETLMQFLPTLDFPRKRLILRTKTASNRKEIDNMKAETRLPFIIDDIHSMYAQCSVNDKDPVLLYFDTGLVDDKGASILAARDRLLELGVLASSAAKSGYADISRLGVGSLQGTNVKALYGPGEQLTYCEYIKPYGLIGHNFLKHYSWTIDFDSRMFLFDY